MANTMVQHEKVGIPVSPDIGQHGLSNASSFDASVVQESTSTRFKPLLILCLRLFLEAHLQRKITRHLEIARNVQILWVSMGPKILHSYSTTQRSLGTRIFEVYTPLHAPRTHRWCHAENAVKNEWCFQQNIDHAPSEPSPQPLRL